MSQKSTAMNYFSHDSNARNDERVIQLRIRHGAAGYGVFFMILERMRDSSTYMCAKDYNIIAFDLRVDAALIKSVVEDFGLFVFTEDGKYFYSESFLNRMQKISSVSRKRSEAGRKGAKVTNAAKAAPKQETVHLEEVAFFAPEPPSEETPPTPPAPPDNPEDLFKTDSPMKEFFTELYQPSEHRDRLCMRFALTPFELEDKLNLFLLDCECRKNIHNDRRDALNHFNDWLRIVTEKEKQQAHESEARQQTAAKRRGVQAGNSEQKDYTAAF